MRKDNKNVRTGGGVGSPRIGANLANKRGSGSTVGGRGRASIQPSQGPMASIGGGLSNRPDPRFGLRLDMPVPMWNMPSPMASIGGGLRPSSIGMGMGPGGFGMNPFMNMLRQMFLYGQLGSGQMPLNIS